MIVSRSRVLRALVAGVATLAVGLVSVPPAEAEPGAGPGGAAGPTATARARVAADVLMSSYEPVKAWFPSSWWNSAVALQTIGDYMERTGDRRYLPQLDNTFEKAKGVFPAGYLSGDPLLGNFTSRAIDDSEWWALTWIQTYDLTKNPKYLAMAVTIAEYVEDYWDNTCGGGVWWDAERTYKNAVTNGLWIRLTAELHNRIPGDRHWLGRAQQGWNWFVGSGMINADGLVNDGLKTGTCQSNNETVWTYNQGLAIGAGLELWRATRNPELLTTVRRLADSAIGARGLVSNGILTESCDVLGKVCDDNQKQFKGIFMRYWMDLTDTTHNRRYTAFQTRQAATVWDNDRDAAGRLGLRWSGAASPTDPNVFDWRTQASALSALIADVPAQPPVRSLSASMSPAQPVVLSASGSATHVKLVARLQATAPAGQRIKAEVRASGPSGWTVSPRQATVTLYPKGNAVPAQAEVELDVTIPGGTADGRYPITVSATSGPLLSFTTQAEILVARTVNFDTGTAAELPWLWDAGGSQSHGPQNRFADGNAYFVYRFPFPSGTTAASTTLTIDNEYHVEVSGDGRRWTTVARETRHIHGGENKAVRTFDLTPHLGPDKAAYVRVSDSFPEEGWGGRVTHVSAAFTS
ncbi:glycoside hydrolase family 76 [Kribbella flavida DSM 17836]|uniref:Glycoside hydrolase family 76 n=1 Tax=Kribbella flavida (strain DSM 17836 / JCM 10339 / NBRC 14399) TaxID=479435 RepID=D2PXT9_KRIFD|nr:glycoside hydrolase family 76 protein [Kribbella flavida]ADB31731.1 glycoside hydrolase family 76 [Kribbella flavida DSM 17836]